MPKEKVKHLQNTKYMLEDGIKYKLNWKVCVCLNRLQAGIQTNLAYPHN
jgi:hypothetical protein